MGKRMRRVRRHLFPVRDKLLPVGGIAFANGLAIVGIGVDVENTGVRVVVLILGSLLAFFAFLAIVLGIVYWITGPRVNFTLVSVATPDKKSDSKRQLVRLEVENVGDIGETRFTLEGLSGATDPLQSQPPLYWQGHYGQTEPKIRRDIIEGCIVADVEPLDQGFQIWPKKPDSGEWAESYTVTADEGFLTVRFSAADNPKHGREFRIRCWREGDEIKAQLAS